MEEHTCSICDGKGTITIEQEVSVCYGCFGTGVVWKEEE